MGKNLLGESGWSSSVGLSDLVGGGEEGGEGGGEGGVEKLVNAESAQ